MYWLKTWRRKRAIRSYLKTLGPLLFEDHGDAQAYSVTEVNQTIRRHGLDTEFAVYALAIYCPKAEFDGIFNAPLHGRGYQALRSDVSALVAADPSLAEFDDPLCPTRAVAGAEA